MDLKDTGESTFLQCAPSHLAAPTGLIVLVSGASAALVCWEELCDLDADWRRLVTAEIAGEAIWLRVQSDPLSVDECMAFAEDPRAGAVVLFSGNVRDHSDGRSGVTLLEYEAYESQVLASFERIAQEAAARFEGLRRIVIHHRLGPCQLGESTVLVVVSSEHRAAGFDAARFCIDSLKQTSPIWKKEHWGGDSDWALGASEIKRIEEL